METDSRAFGPYEIVRRLGVGGMAETFLALRRGLHGVEQRVCLKRVLPAFASDPSFLRQFEREAAIASTLRFTGIVSVVEYGDVDGAKYLALELVDGVDLRDFLASRPGHVLDPPTVGRLALDLGYALRYAHQPGRGVVHRDVSPANVMLSRTGEVKLTDFGVARVMSSAAPTTSTGVRGKIAYMCPEQLRGEELDGRADLFALGVLLFECLCGERPFHGAHDVEIMRRIGAGERPHVRERAPQDTPLALVAAIEGLLETDRDARTPHATALIEQLSSLPGLHQARRRLAAQVDELRGGVHTREHVTDEREERSDTRLDPVPAAALAGGTAVPVNLRGSGVTPTLGGLDGSPVALRPHRAVALSAPAELPVLVAAGVERRSLSRSPAWLAMAAVLLVALGAAGLWTWAERSAQVDAAGRRPAFARAAAASAGAPARAEAERGPDTRESQAPRAVEVPVVASATGAGTTTNPRAGTRAADPSQSAEAPEVGAARPSLPEAPAVSPDVIANEPEEDARPGTLRVTVIPWGDVWVDGRYMGRAPTEVSLRPGRHVVAAGTDRPARRRSVQVTAGQLRRVELELEP